MRHRQVHSTGLLPPSWHASRPSDRADREGRAAPRQALRGGAVLRVQPPFSRAQNARRSARDDLPRPNRVDQGQRPGDSNDGAGFRREKCGRLGDVAVRVGRLYTVERGTWNVERGMRNSCHVEPHCWVWVDSVNLNR